MVVGSTSIRIFNRSGGEEIVPDVNSSETHQTVEGVLRSRSTVIGSVTQQENNNSSENTNNTNEENQIIDIISDTEADIEGIVRSNLQIQGNLHIGTPQTSDIMFVPFLPEIGEQDVLYVNTSNNMMYYWDGAMYRTLSQNSEDFVVVKTTAEWNAVPNYKSKKRVFYVYLDHRVQNGQFIPGVKIGDGSTYVCDLPFFCAGVTDEDIEFWNNKVSCKISSHNDETVVFYTDKGVGL